MNKKVAFLAVIPLAFALAACSQSEANAPMSLAAKVASIDAGTSKPENSVEVARAREALGGAAKVCRENEDHVGDMAAFTRNALKEKQTSVSLVEVLEMIPQAVGQAKIENVGGCARLLSMYLTAREAGQNHMAATNGMRGVLKVVAQ